MKRFGTIVLGLFIAALLIGWFGFRDEILDRFASKAPDKTINEPEKPERPSDSNPTPTPPESSPEIGSLQGGTPVIPVFARKAWNPMTMEQDDLQELMHFASETISSPGGRLKAFLSPVDFETLSDLYIEDTRAATRWQLELHLNGQQTPKKVAWLDDTRLLVIVGYAFGTASPGGDVYLVDAKTGSGSLWYKPSGHRQVTDIHPAGKQIVLTVVQFDDNYQDHTAIQVRVPRP